MLKCCLEGRLSVLFAILALVLMALPTATVAEDGVYAKTDPTYHPDPSAVAALHEIDQPTEIILFHGLWCKDCQREIPRFYKIITLADNPNITVTEYEVNNEKRDLLGKFEEYGIQMVPTFVVIQEDRELGRIIETPRTSLEEDLMAITNSPP